MAHKLTARLVYSASTRLNDSGFLFFSMESKVYNADCLEGMKQYPDKWFDLAVVDPPYGLGDKLSIGGTSHMKFCERYQNGEKWDNAIPTPEYFSELFRISKNQIIWGGNYFALPPTRGFIVWDKKQPLVNFSAAEFAWTSFWVPSKIFSFSRSGGATDNNKIHPTQKPISLYGFIYRNFLPTGGTVIDTHLGSGSNRIAADKAGNIDFTAYEIDKDYFEAQEKRFKDYKAQGVLF